VASIARWTYYLGQRDPNYQAVGSRGIGVASTDPIFALNQYVSSDGTVIEYGAVRGPAARIVSELAGREVEAKYVRWSEDTSISIFWLRHQGPGIPPNTQVDEVHRVPLAPQRYPLFSAYDSAGHLIGSTRLRPAGTELKGG